MINILKFSKLSILAVLAFFVMPTNAANAAPACGERAKFTKHLDAKYKEQPRALGVSQTGKALFEVYVSQEGSWTLLMTTSKGASCIMAAGHSWQESDKLALLPRS